MKLIASVSTVLSIAVGSEAVSSTLTFDEALALAGRSASSRAAAPLGSEMAGLRRSRLPSVRAEMTANASRTMDLFAEGPLEGRSATSVIAFDYPLWGGGLTGARIDAVEARLRRLADRGRLDDGRFVQLLDAFGELYFTQKHIEVVRALSDQLTAEASRSERLLSEGELSNLTATERRDIAIAFASRLVELESRRRDAAIRLRVLTGIEGEPNLVLELSELATAATLSESVSDDFLRVTTIAVEESRARLRVVTASDRFRATLSGFGGFGSASSEFRGVRSDDSFGVYGLRIHLSYPLLGGTGGIGMAEARAEVEQSMAMREAAIAAATARASDYRSREQTSRNRITLLRESLEAAKARVESLQRLVSAGIRSQSDLTYAQAERIRREGDLLAAEIERWKAARLLARMTTEDPH